MINERIPADAWGLGEAIENAQAPYEPYDLERDMTAIQRRQLSHRVLEAEEERDHILRWVRARSLQSQSEPADVVSGEERRLREQLITDGLYSREVLIRFNQRLIASIAKMYVGMPFVDLMQEGNLGLMKALEKFNAAKNVRLSTYATWWIRQTIIRAMQDQSRIIRLSNPAEAELSRLRKARSRLFLELDHEPTVAELAEATELPVEKVEFLLDWDYELPSLDESVGDGEDSSTRGERTQHKGPSVVDQVETNMLRERMAAAIDSLGMDKWKIVLKCRFGWHTGEKMTLEETGKLIGVGKERVRQLEAEAIRHLKTSSHYPVLQQYFSALLEE